MSPSHTIAHPRRKSFYHRRGKRWFDTGAAAVLLALLSPLLAATAAFVWIVLGRPILFQQTRPGLGAAPFTLYKFRTMRSAREGTDDARRLGRFGRRLRKSSLDELPTLWNVVRGDLSLVGPRPLLPRYVERYTPEQARRHEVRPGVTGWAQVNGRNALTWDDKFRHDLWYVDHATVWLDLKILALTVGVVLRGRGVSAEGHATMPEFKGDNG